MKSLKSKINIIKIAYHPLTGKFIHIDNAANGLDCESICLKCKERLQAIQGEIRDKHFRHHINIACQGSQETALHELGKQILVDNEKLNIPDYGTIIYSKPIAEKPLERVRPDVTVIHKNEKVYFEIFVSHAVDNGKEKFFRLGKHKSVEIDLSNCTTSSFEEIKKIVLEELDNKKVFYWQNEEEINQDNGINEWISRIINWISKYWKISFGLVILIVLYSAFRRKK